MADISREIQVIQLAARGEEVRDAIIEALSIINTSVPDAVYVELDAKVDKASVGAANGVAELDGAGKVFAAQLPSYVDDVQEYATVADFPATGESGKIYVATTTNLTYRWSGSAYVEISPSLALGETSGTAYRGDRGKTAFDHSQATGNPHGTTKSDVGLGNVDNTPDADKSVSKAATLTTARTIDGVSFNGSAAITHYGTCSTAAATAAKTVSCTGFSLVTGARISVKFTVTNTASTGSLTLNVNGTGAKAIKYRNGNLPYESTLEANRLFTFIYDGTYYQLEGDLTDQLVAKLAEYDAIAAGNYFLVFPKPT